MVLTQVIASKGLTAVTQPYQNDSLMFPVLLKALVPKSLQWCENSVRNEKGVYSSHFKVKFQKYNPSHMSLNTKRLETLKGLSKVCQSLLNLTIILKLWIFKSQDHYLCAKNSDNIWHGRACSFSFFTNYIHLAATKKWEALMGYVLFLEAQAGNVTFLAIHTALQQRNLMHIWKTVKLSTSE